MEHIYNDHQSVSVGEWFLTLIVAAIPVIGLLSILLWAFGKGASSSKRNWAQAILIIYILGAVFGIFFWSSLFTFFSTGIMSVC